MISLCSVEYQKLLKTVCFKITAASPSFIQSYRNLAEIFDTPSALDLKGWI